MKAADKDFVFYQFDLLTATILEKDNWDNNNSNNDNNAIRLIHLH